VEKMEDRARKTDKKMREAEDSEKLQFRRAVDRVRWAKPLDCTSVLHAHVKTLHCIESAEDCAQGAACTAFVHEHKDLQAGRKSTSDTKSSTKVTKKRMRKTTCTSWVTT